VQTRLEAFLDIVRNYRTAGTAPPRFFCSCRLTQDSRVVRSIGDAVTLTDPRVRIVLPNFSQTHMDLVATRILTGYFLREPMLIAFNKPFGVLSQFTGDGSPNRALAEFHFPKDVYPIGRLDADSEGLLLLSDEPAWNERLLHPRHSHEREYWAQVERIPTPEILKQLGLGISIQGRKTLPCRAWILEPQPKTGWGETPSSPDLKWASGGQGSTESRPTTGFTSPCG